jgi:hypothetical protein
VRDVLEYGKASIGPISPSLHKILDPLASA